jgi:protein-S-isoprenylcysteine O-methyltransferase Ste14
MNFNWIDLTLFIAGSLLLAWLSRKPLRRPGSHGFYRFFAWELMLVLGLLNRPQWDADPFSPHQLTSRVLTMTSLVLVLAAVIALRRHGAATRQRTDGALYDWEKTSRLVNSGIYRYIRHPMYASLMALNWGIFMQAPSWLGAAPAVIASFFLLLTMRQDEIECLRYFGDAYADYMRRTARFIPGVY